MAVSYDSYGNKIGIGNPSRRFTQSRKRLCIAITGVIVLGIIGLTVAGIFIFGKKSNNGSAINNNTTTVTTTRPPHVTTASIETSSTSTNRPPGSGFLCGLSTWNENGIIIAEELYGPRDLFIDGEYVYISETLNNRLMRYHLGSSEKQVILSDVTVHAMASNKEEQTIYFSQESANKESINRIAKDGQGEATEVVSSDYIEIIYSLVAMNESLYICDRNRHRVILWSTIKQNFTIIAGGNGLGSGPSGLRAPEGIFVDANGDTYVADTLNHRIQLWKNGALEGITVAGNEDSIPGQDLNELHRPKAIFVHGETMFIADSYNHRIVKWKIGDSRGSVIVGSNSTGSGNGLNQLNNPTSLKLDSSGNLYVVDSDNSRVQKYIVDNSLC
ncbi:unnamed protein product [Adineta steineri]|uniref:NHL repeat containing protein-like protein n=1 Tax=Adineta steineri TaxID=433720 RepID=A0A819FBE4_9BILA|nr:unnamed protein product [Adineta steineri]CAF3863477.1 unnamed protein product [Adineta steineri]